MPPEKLRLPQSVRAAFQSARKPKTQKELAHDVHLDEGLVGHYETGRYPVPKARFWKMVRAIDLPDERAQAWWRLAIEKRVDELLTDGGMSDEARAHVRWSIQQGWHANAEGQTAVPRRARTA